MLMGVPIKGVQKTTLVDFSPHVAATVFLGGCCFRCGFCHNPELVVGHESLPTTSEDELFEFLKSREGFIDGVCVSGGEPTVNKELPEFLKKIKALGLKVKLDTNGTNPEMLRELIKCKILDKVAMDIKGKPEDYDEITGVKVDISKIKESVEILKGSDIDYEFRITLLPDYHSQEDLITIGEWLKGAKLMVLQKFENVKPLINKEFQTKRQYMLNDYISLRESLKPYFKEVKLNFLE
jgi:pyruvate formate lyase activating enzyme